MTTLLLVIAIIAILMLPVGVFLGWQFHKLIARIEYLETTAKQGLPYKIARGLEDATAIGNDVRWRGSEPNLDGIIAMVNRVKADLAYQDERTAQLTDALKDLRAGPSKYDTEKPSQKHPA